MLFKSAVFILLSLFIISGSALRFAARRGGTRWGMSTALAAGPRPLHKVFTVEKATDAQIAELGVKSWPVWETEGTSKYKTGILSPLKVYDCNELSYIISGRFTVTPEGGEPVNVEPGDFITFPDGFRCNWLVIEPVTKHWFIY